MHCVVAAGTALSEIGHLLTLHKLHGVEVKHQHVVQFFGELKDAAKNVHP